MPDGWEVYYNLNPIGDYDADSDEDNDGYDANRNSDISPNERHTNWKNIWQVQVLGSLIQMETGCQMDGNYFTD